MIIKHTMLAAAAIMVLGAAAPAMAQNTNIDAGGGKGLVVVDISNIRADIADALDVNVEDLVDINSVQVPINAAATVCNLEVNAIARDNDKGSKSCTAETTSEAVNQAVQQQL